MSMGVWMENQKVPSQLSVGQQQLKHQWRRPELGVEQRIVRHVKREEDVLNTGKKSNWIV